MAHRKTIRRRGSTSGRASRSRIRVAGLLPGARLRRRWFKQFSRAPTVLQLIVSVALISVIWLALNGIYQVVRKPSELFFPVSDAFYKTPSATWRQYGKIFRKHSTQVITADFLAALAQVEASGNPIARTYWRWSLTHRPFEVYRPASSAVGMYQFTDSTFAAAKHYCIRNHVVIEDGPWHDLRSCWFNRLYARTVPSHAVEMTAAYLDRRVAQTLSRYRISTASRQQKQDLATVIHLCGAGAGAAYARRGLHLTAGQRCGDHDVRAYLRRIHAMQRVFARLAS